MVTNVSGPCMCSQCPRCACRLPVVPVTSPEVVAKFSSRPGAPWRSSARWCTPAPTTGPKFHGTEDDRPFWLVSPRGEKTILSLILYTNVRTWRYSSHENNYISLEIVLLFEYNYDLMSSIMNRERV